MMRMPCFATKAAALPPVLALALATAGAAMAVDAPKSVTAALKDAGGAAAGTVTLSDMGGDHLMGRIDASGLKPGNHGMHIHMVGKCEGPDFTSAGAHLNPAGKKHGLESAAGPHEGDLPQLIVGQDGKGSLSFMSQSKISDILDSDGGSFIVHADPDDQKTDPGGNSGARLLWRRVRAGLTASFRRVRVDSPLSKPSGVTISRQAMARPGCSGTAARFRPGQHAELRTARNIWGESTGSSDAQVRIGQPRPALFCVVATAPIRGNRRQRG